MFFFFFKKPILTSQRRKALDEFREQAVKALRELKGSAKDGVSKRVFNRMILNVERTPIYFYPRKSLRERIFSVSGRVFGSVVKGERVNQIRIFQRGKHLFVVQSSFINLPAEHIFDGDRLSIEGVFTLSHEYAHFPKPALRAFAKRFGMGVEQAEELLADVLAAKLAAKLGFSRENILRQLAGREIVYGGIPFRRFVMRAVGK